MGKGDSRRKKLKKICLSYLHTLGKDGDQVDELATRANEFLWSNKSSRRLNKNRYSPFLHGGGARGSAKLLELFGVLMVRQDRRGKAAAAEALPCPRCKSRETKFCYFDNYDVNQPRHLCKACRRYWTAGGGG